MLVLALCLVVVVTGSRVDCVGPSSRLVSPVNGTGYLSSLVSDIAIFVPKRDVKLQLTN